MNFSTIHDDSTRMRNDDTGRVFGDIEGLTGPALFNHLVDRFSSILIWLALLALLSSVSRAWKSAWHPLFDVQIAFFLIVSIIFLFRKRIGARYTALALITSLFGVSVLGLVAYGPNSAGSAVVLAGVSIIAGAIYGRSAGMWTAFWVCVSFTVVSIGAVSNWWPVIGGFDFSASSPFAWLNIGIDMLAVSATVVLCIAAIQDRLIRAVKMNRAENAFTKAVVNAQQDLLVVFDPTRGKLIYWNKAFRDFTGLTDEAVEQRRLPDGWSDHILLSPAALGASIQRFLTGTRDLVELDLLNAKGEKIPVEFRGKVVDLPDHARVVVCIGRDLRERRKLREREQHLRLITESIPVATWAVNHAGQHVYMSSNIFDICGFTADEILQDGLKLWVPRIHKDDQAPFRDLFTSLLQNGRIIDHRYRFITKDGREIWLHERAVKTSGKSGEPAACGVLLDVTEQVQAAERLYRSEKLQALGELAGGVAHDFNNQISAIIGLAELISLEVSENPLLKRYTEELSRCADHAAALPEQLLMFARKNEKEPTRLDVHEVIRQTMSILSRSLNRGIRIETRLDASNPIIFADVSRLQNALLNLCLNARDAMPKGGEILVHTYNAALEENDNSRPSLAPGDYLFLSVRDTGEGMDEATKRRIFEPFFTTKPEGRGTGMGLAMVFGFVKGLGGDIEVVSSPNRGTAMTLLLPGFEPALATEEPSIPKSILVVDDESPVLSAIKKMLEEIGMQVTACRSGKEAILEYQKRKEDISLVIVDMVMPELSGSETLAALRRIHNDVPVLLISALASDEEVERTLNQGALGFLPKPFSRPELKEKIHTILSVGTRRPAYT